MKNLPISTQTFSKIIDGNCVYIDKKNSIYRKALLDHLEDNEVAKKMRDILKNFYIFIKGTDEHLRFVFITGISRFSQTSIFSGLNQLVDISMNPDFAHLVGCTELEISHFLPEHLIATSRIRETSVQKLVSDLRYHYNGYRFWKDSPHRIADQPKEIERIFNPFSVVNALHNNNLENYWFKSGTPSFLVKLLRQNDYPIESFENMKAGLNELEIF